MKNLLFAFIAMFVVNTTFAQTSPPSSDQVLAEAFKEAKKQKKKVFVKFSASWCGWCHKMDDSMNDPELKAYFDKSFVIKHLIVMESKGKENLENPGAMDLMKKYNSDGFGIPLWFIFDENGKLLVDSHLRPEGVGMEVKGKNIIGCPAAKEEVDSFVKSLKATTKLTDAELAKIYARFRKNDPAYRPETTTTPVKTSEK
ncbi:thioredoxin family protein [Pedobacter frigiditerrae]|uniref:thioredoxin family protein n=1 Tax=Pedobacter frigiditerrae TaxID=2530452 RepID=UPI00292CC2EB|nr:thioredoxin family protein [Pedobacter frigiditerrae]